VTPEVEQNIKPFQRYTERRGYFDPRVDSHTVKILPGEYYVTTRTDEMLVTVLGSCVAACIRNPHNGAGGMNHFMLPVDSSEADAWNITNPTMRYGNHAMEVLINEILKTGCSRDDLEIKLFGGANVLPKGQNRSLDYTTVGDRNCEFVRRYLQNEGLKVAASDLGGDLPRRIHFYPETGKVDRLLLRGADKAKVYAEERNLGIPEPAVESDDDIELFD